jgi:hypothetical protein
LPEPQQRGVVFVTEGLAWSLILGAIGAMAWIVMEPIEEPQPQAIESRDRSD